VKQYLTSDNNIIYIILRQSIDNKLLSVVIFSCYDEFEEISRARDVCAQRSHADGDEVHAPRGISTSVKKNTDPLTTWFSERPPIGV